MMEIIYREGEATAGKVRESMRSPPGYSSVRTTLRILEEKGCLSHRKDGPRYVFFPTVPRARARRSALRRLVETFFADAPENAFETLLDISGPRLSADELARISRMIDRARKEGR